MTRDTFIEHVTSCQKPFRRFLTALCCGDSQLADDIAQESFIKAYLSCDGLEDTARFNAWVYKIGVNTFISHRRSAKKTADIDSVAEALSSDTSDSSFRYQALYSALDSLPERERTSVVHYYLEGYSVREIADIVQVSQDAVKQHLFRGRKHLRSILEENENGR